MTVVLPTPPFWFVTAITLQFAIWVFLLCINLAACGEADGYVGKQNDRLLLHRRSFYEDTRGHTVHIFSWTLFHPQIILLILLQYGTKISRILRETHWFSKELKSSKILDIPRLFGHYRTHRYTVKNEIFWTPKRNAPGSNPGKRAIITPRCGTHFETPWFSRGFSVFCSSF